MRKEPVVEPEDFEVHLATCSDCARELARYREVIAAVGSLRDVLEDPPPGFAERVIAHVLEPERPWRGVVRRAASDRRIHVAAASLGGALLGAGTIALLWWRSARRDVLGSRVPV
jgi:anti-sigma factor RsiW